MNYQNKIALLAALLVALAGCAESTDAEFVKLKTEVPPITGGFSYKQYVVANPGDTEVLGDEGVFYISPSMFTDDQLKHIGESESGNSALRAADGTLAEGRLNMCFSAMAHGTEKAASAGMYSRLVVTWAHKYQGGIGFTLYSWPDAWYGWSLKGSGAEVFAEDPSVQHDFGWQSTRIELMPDPSVTLDTCLHYHDAAVTSNH